jgi:3-phosphoinositide dependent protein kinase-1
MLQHPNIVQLFYTFQDSESLYYVLELCPNGELLDLIKKVGRFDEATACFYTAEILNGIQYMHSKGEEKRKKKVQVFAL